MSGDYSSIQPVAAGEASPWEETETGKRILALEEKLARAERRLVAMANLLAEALEASARARVQEALRG